MAAFLAGEIVVVDWRDALPEEPNKLRPAVVVEDDRLFDPAYPNVILVPLTHASHLAIGGLSVTIEPTAENGCATRCYALSHCVATISGARVRRTGSTITGEQLRAIRRQIAFAVGLS